jgi:hypothetical protein
VAKTLSQHLLLFERPMVSKMHTDIGSPQVDEVRAQMTEVERRLGAAVEAQEVCARL